MISKEDIDKLAALARIAVPEDQKEKVRKDIESILDYISDIKEAHSKKKGEALPLEFNYDSGVTNVFREDTNPHEPGIYTEKLLKSAPETEGNYVKVKKIL